MKVARIMLVIMSHKLQNNFESLRVFKTDERLKEMIQEQDRQEKFEIIKSLMASKNQDEN